MATIFGSARIDEYGKAMGGKAGDQTGKEVSTQNAYVQSNDKKRWRVLRFKDEALAEIAAQTMQDACDNRMIGYDQGQRYTLWEVAEPLGFDLKRVAKPCEVDCSELIRNIMARLGHKLPKFRTTNQIEVLMATGLFVLHDEEKYTRQTVYLRRGDIEVTKIQGHTGIILSNGTKAHLDNPTDANPYGEPSVLIRMSSTSKSGVKWVQWHLNRLGYDLGRWGVDGDFGAMTDAAVRAFQKAQKIEVDGRVGKITRGKFKTA